MRFCTPLVRVHKLQNGVYGRRIFSRLHAVFQHRRLVVLRVEGLVFGRGRGVLARGRLHKRFQELKQTERFQGKKSPYFKFSRKKREKWGVFVCFESRFDI